MPTSVRSRSSRARVFGAWALAVLLLNGCAKGAAGDGPAVCGDGVVDPGEQCDGANLDGADCEALGLGAGVLGCAPGCTFDTAGCQPVFCGDGRVEGTETCDDANNVDGDGCSALCLIEDGYSCIGEPSVCQQGCGNGAVDAGEACDGFDLGGATCASLGFAGGVLICTANCTHDTTGCTAGANCGNGMIDPGEECEGANLNGMTCALLGFSGGTLACGGACQYDTSGCTSAACGDGNVDVGEQCDGANLGGATCQSLGFDGGALLCSAGCQHDTSGCTSGVCGDGALDAGEECDGAELNGATCQSLGFFSGTLVCGAGCVYDTSGCGVAGVCGDGAVDAGEECDDGNTLGGDGCSSTCTSENTCVADGTIGCAGSRSGNLWSSGDSISGYSGCGTNDAYEDDIWSFVASNSGTASADLNVIDDGLLGDDFDVYVLEGACNPVACVAYGANGGDDYITFTVTAGMTYYVVIEAFSLGLFSSNDYDLDLSCP